VGDNDPSGQQVRNLLFDFREFRGRSHLSVSYPVLHSREIANRALGIDQPMVLSHERTVTKLANGNLYGPLVFVTVAFNIQSQEITFG
jgi:hypothetical protein